MKWRRFLGFDPAGRDGGVAVWKSPAGVFGVHTEQLRRSAEAFGSAVRASDMINGRDAVKIDLRDPGKLNRLVDELTNYRPPDQGGNPLPDKEKQRMHGLHLDDYQPRSHEHGVQRITYERAYPPVPEWDAEDAYLHQRPDTRWVDSRNRSPLHGDGWMLPPMRDALADLQEHLRMVERKLAEQMLVAVEVSVEHEPTPSRADGSGQGWNFAVRMLAVPQGVLDTERERYAEFLAKQEEQKAEMERRRAAHG